MHFHTNVRATLLLLLLVLLSCACNDPKTVSIHLENKSTQPLDSVRIVPSGLAESTTFIALPAGGSASYKLTAENWPRTDGHYLLSFKRNGRTEQHIFGYYTNGYPLEQSYLVRIGNEVEVVPGR